MGVVYKITDKVKDFIIKEKKENPEISCRSLAAIANKKFQLSLSKSSINSIFKQAGLSNPVGRRPRFQPQPAAEKVKAELPKTTLFLKQKPVDLLEAPLPEPIVIKEDKIEEPALEAVIQSQVIDIKEDEEIDNLGFFFLKAAEWQVSGPSILGEAVRPYLSGYIPAELERKSEVLLYLTAFGLTEISAMQAYEGKGLWAINQLKNKQDLLTLSQFLDRLQAIRTLTLAMLGTANQAFSEIGFFKLILADNTVIYLDGQLHSLWQDSDIPVVMSSTIYKTKSYIKDCFLDNVQSVNIFAIPGYIGFSQIFYEFVYACENFPQKRMMRLSAHGMHKDEIFPPIKLPEAKRNFVIGFWPWQEEGASFIREDIRIVKSFYSESFDKEIYYSEMKVNLPQYQSFQGVKIRAALLRDTGLGWPRMGILTNISDELPMDEIISQYLIRWPNSDEGYQDFLKKSEKSGLVKLPPGKGVKAISPMDEAYTLTSNKMDLGQNLANLVNNLSSFCQAHFFPVEYAKADFPTMKQRFYTLSGRIKRRGQDIVVSLISPAGYGLAKELLYAAKRLNESDIHDPAGNKLWLKVG